MNRNLNLNVALGFTGLFSFSSKLALAVLCLSFSASSALAAVIPLVHYRAGENDPGAVSGASANATTVDFTSNMLDATLGGSATYTNNTPYAPSKLALDLPGSVNYTRPVVTTAQNNWGVEGWVKFDALSSSNTQIIYNGNAGSNGFGLLTRLVSGSVRWHTLFGGANFGDTGIAVTPGIWQHVAAVRDNGTSSFYLNGVQMGNTFTTTPGVPTGNLVFGGLDGQMDEVRVFSFNPGEFDPATDLLYSASNLQALLPVQPVPEPSSVLLVGLGMLLLTKKRRSTQSTQ